ncbi:MAG TPA: DUF350 domain-containing protein [Acidobacteriota bacterium]|nr:DUF350 domain-containing protein [Acidobacteriota bacterium]
MTLDQVLSGLVYLVSVLILFLIGRFVFDKILHRSFSLRHELLEKDNVALALAVSGYYFGLVIALGGVLFGPSSGLVNDLIDIFVYGLLSIVLLNFSIWVNDRILLSSFSNEKEIIQDRNAGMGAVEAGNHVAVGLIVAGAISGQGGGIGTALAFWIIAQAVLIVGARIYDWITPYSLHDEIEKDNVAVGVAFAGVLVALGNIVGAGIYGDFYSWTENLTVLGQFVLFGFILLPVVRWVTDKVLLPGASLTDELVNQEHPNLGAGIIEAFSYIAASFLIGWIV